MNNIINKLYYGEIIPCEKPAPNTKRFAENRELICSTEEQLHEQFPDCKELLDTNAGGIEGFSQKHARCVHTMLTPKYRRSTH
ncbi:MAG: hypothetical protein J6O50_05845 [Ruminiclostridium sp.]|nr:hypothetical protein [Ruminiclostridium sp.]